MKTRLLSRLIIALCGELSLSSACTRPHLGAFIQILLLSPSAVCHVYHTWPRRPLTSSFERDTQLSDRWMFFCFVLQTLVCSYSFPDNPTGLADSQRSSHSCSRNVHFFFFPFFVFLGGSGDISMHHILATDKQTWRREVWLHGGGRGGLKSKTCRKFQRKGHGDDAFGPSHTLNELDDVCRL